MHVHVRSDRGEAKFWLEPDVELAKNIGYSQHHLHEIRHIVEVKRNELVDAWNRHFRDRGD